MNSLPPTKRNSLIIILAIVVVFTSAGSSGISTGVSAGGDEWRPVDPSDLALKAPLVEPDADAEAIFWDVRIDDGGENDLVLSHYVRIKVFTQLGCDKQSKIDIPYFSGTKMKDVAARTVRPDGSITEVAKEDITERVIVRVSGVKLRARSFAFPRVEPGAIIEYKWKEVISSSSANHMRLQFQRDIPVESITYHIKPSSSLFDVRPFNMPRPHFEKEKNGFYSTTVKNMPAFHEEPMMPPEDSVRSWAMINYNSLFSVLGYTTLASQVYFGFQPFLKVDDEVKSKSAEIVAGATTPEEKLEKIYSFCRNNIKNISDKTSGFTADEIEKMKENKKPADTLKRGAGKGVDIDLLFAALVTAAGLEARVALVPDRSKIFFDRTVVIPGSLRPSNIAVRVYDKWEFFDPGFHYVVPGMLPWWEEGVSALIAAPAPVWAMTPLSPPEKSREKRIANLRLDEDGTLEGDVTIEYTGHLAVERKEYNDDDSPNQREETLKAAVKKRLSTAELTNIVIENVTDPTKPFIYKYHVRVPDYAQRTGKRLFLQPAFFEKGLGPLFVASTRKYAIYFHFPWSEEDSVTISLPKGYVLDNPDAPTPISAGAVSRYVVKIQKTGDGSTLFYHRNFFFGGDGGTVVPVGSYGPVKQLFDGVHISDNHTITLKQSASPN
jgi:hypothetical protein